MPDDSSSTDAVAIVDQSADSYRAGRVRVCGR